MIVHKDEHRRDGGLAEGTLPSSILPTHQYRLCCSCCYCCCCCLMLLFLVLLLLLLLLLLFDVVV